MVNKRYFSKLLYHVLRVSSYLVLKTSDVIITFYFFESQFIYSLNRKCVIYVVIYLHSKGNSFNF